MPLKTSHIDIFSFSTKNLREWGNYKKKHLLCSSQQGMSFQLSKIVTEALEPIAEVFKKSLEILSSEDVLSSFDNFNAELIAKPSQSRSVDAIALFPSRNIYISCKVVDKQILACNVELHGVRRMEMQRYIILDMTKNESVGKKY